jgi:hypothetical protein
MGSKKNKINYQMAVQNKRVPILTLDARWHELFPNKAKSFKIKSLEAKVNNELKKHGRLRSDLQEFTNLKKKLLDGIVDNMQGALEDANNKEQNKLEQGKKIVEELNVKMEKTQDELTAIPRELDRSNKELLAESMEYCYNRMQVNTESINKLDRYIKETREMIKEKIIQMQEMKEENSMIYTYLHDVLGPDILELMDLNRYEHYEKKNKEE